MTSIPRSDEELDLVLASRDPVDRSDLTTERVVAALEALHDEILGGELPGRQRVRARPAPINRRPARRRWRPALAVTSIAAMILALIALVPAAVRRGGRLGPAPASAVVILDRAADTALGRSPLYPGPRQLQYLKTEQLSIAGEVWFSVSRQDWYRPDGSGRERIIETGRGWLPGVSPARGQSVWYPLPNQSVDGLYPAGGIAFSSLSPRGLATQPAALLVAIERDLRRHGFKATPADVFNAISNGLLVVSNSPPLRAALYHVIAHLPGVRLVGWRTDRIGRRGIEVAIVQPEGTPDVLQELLFDPSTGDELEARSVLATPFRTRVAPEPGGGTRYAVLPRGTVMGYTVLIGRGIVDSMTQLPGGGPLPFHPFIGGPQR